MFLIDHASHYDVYLVYHNHQHTKYEIFVITIASEIIASYTMDLHDTGIGVETVYGTHEDSHMVMSEKVQSLAGSIYQEFERMIARYDEDVVKTLMPLLVNVLECLDAAYQSNQEQDVELELLREDNEQLVTQYEREKVARKNSEQKLLEFEDASEGERKEFLARQEALESIARMLELKHKNSMEHAGRLEEREAELKKEYAKLHERYTDLFKTHMDYMERTKLLLSGGQLANERSESSRLAGNRLNIGRSSGPVSFGFASLENAEGIDSVPTSPISSTHSSPSLHSELDNAKEGLRTVEKGLETDMISLENKSTSPASPQATPLHNNNSGAGRVKKEQRSGNTLYQELSFQDSDALCDDDGADQITGGWVHPGEYASSGMGKEVENLIMENNELLATKNALNVVKDDLIVQVDALTGELEMLREEILSLNMSRTRQRERITELEEELKKMKETQEVKPENNEEESEVPMAQRKRFTRVEMARVLMERNQYKERFMELQEAVRWSELMRAHKQGPELKNKQSVWKYFMNLFNAERTPRDNEPMLRFQAGTNQVTPGVRNLPARTQDFPETEMGSLAKQRERREQYRHVRAHVKKEDGRLTAYGWSLPDKSAVVPSRGLPNMSGVPVPVPVYCRPLEESSSGMKIWCAAGVNLQGGYTKDGGLMVGGSVFYSDNLPTAKPASNELDSLDKELDAATEASRLETKLSSLVWICTSMRAASIVTVIDANNPAEILNSFGVCAHHVLCIASVPGASPDDYSDNKYVIPEENVEADPKPQEEKSGDNDEDPDYGKVTYEDSNTTVKNKRVQIENAKLEQEQETAEEAISGAPSNDSTAETIDTSCGSETERPPTTTHEVMSSALATMWLGAQNGEVYVHSSVANWNQCLHSVQLADAVLNIVHVSGRVICALANGTMVVFNRDDSGEWDLSKYNIVQIGCAFHSIRCLAVVADKVWCGYRNKVTIMDPISLKLVRDLTAHPRKESQVRQFAWHGEGVWLSVRLDSTLRLYHAQTYEHLQDVDIEPYVSKMLGAGKLGFSLVRISALLISSNRLWIGTSNGVIISVPLSDYHAPAHIIVNARNWRPGIESGPRSHSSNPLIPYCNVAHAQLSFHGHRDSVKFFVAVPGNGGMSAASTPSEAHSAGVLPMSAPSKAPPAMLVMSGGEGYIDFRIGESEMDESMVGNESGDLEGGGHSEQRDEKSHLIVWQVISA